MLKPWSGEYIRQLFIPPYCPFLFIFKLLSTSCSSRDRQCVRKMMGITLKQICESAHHEQPLRASDWQILLVQFGQILKWNLRSGEKPLGVEWVGWGVGHLKSCLHHSYCYSNALVWSLVGNMLNKLTAIFQMWETTTQEFNYHKNLCLTFPCTTKHFYLIPKNDRRVHWDLGGPSLVLRFCNPSFPKWCQDFISWHLVRHATYCDLGDTFLVAAHLNCQIPLF